MTKHKFTFKVEIESEWVPSYRHDVPGYFEASVVSVPEVTDTGTDEESAVQNALARTFSLAGDKLAHDGWPMPSPGTGTGFSWGLEREANPPGVLEGGTPLAKLITDMRAEVDQSEAESHRKTFSTIVPRANDKIRYLLDLVETLYAIASDQESPTVTGRSEPHPALEPLANVEALQGDRWAGLR